MYVCVREKEDRKGNTKYESTYDIENLSARGWSFVYLQNFLKAFKKYMSSISIRASKISYYDKKRNEY